MNPSVGPVHAVSISIGPTVNGGVAPLSKSSSITVHTAATLPEEFEFISAIADELADDTRKLVYLSLIHI